MILWASIVVYTNPLSQWFWESGAAKWSVSVFSLIVIAVCALMIWDDRGGKK